jgi:hypothetical protein
MSDPQPLIRDIPSIQKTLDGIRAFRQFKRALPILKPFLRLLGVNVDQIDAALIDFDELAREGEELARIPDRFNDMFVDRGWIIYDRMSLEVAKAAVLKAEAGDIDGAETDLVAHYDAKTIQWGLMSMHAVAAFRPRMRLAELALEDYEAERYYACVPVVLALLDGMVNELHQKAHNLRRGISAKGVDLTAWDSFSAHSRGLGRLVKILQTGRRKTSTDPIFIPYRNGILHGIDLGYDNRVTAAKTWATLFAAREWAIKVEEGHVKPPPPEPAKTWKAAWKELQETAQGLKDRRAQSERLAEWTPRELEVGVHVPRTGAPEAFTTGTPERRVAEYLSFWQKRNYGHMAQCISSILGPSTKSAPAEVRAAFGTKQFLAFEITDVRDEAPAITEIETELRYVESGSEVRKRHKFRMVCADAEGHPAMPGRHGTGWAVVTWAVW